METYEEEVNYKKKISVEGQATKERPTISSSYISKSFGVLDKAFKKDHQSNLKNF
jgi:hypothetical protein